MKDGLTHHTRSPLSDPHSNDATTDSRTVVFIYTVGPLIIESLWANKRVSAGALGALDDPLDVQTKILKSVRVPVDHT